MSTAEAITTNPLLPDSSQSEKKIESFWNGRQITLSHETKAALKVAGLLLLGILGAGIMATGFCALPFSWPVVVLGIVGAGLVIGTIWGFYKVTDQLKKEIAANRVANGVADPTFFKQLFGLNSAGDPHAWLPVQIIATFLEGKNATASLELKEAAARGRRLEEGSSDIHTEARNIRQALGQGKNQLLALSKKTKVMHALGVRFSHDPASPDRIICSIFNSGTGLDHHEQLLGKKKCDLEYRISIPRELLTEEVIQSILDKKGTVDELYKTIDSLKEKGAKRILLAEKMDGRFQVCQKTGNCATEWVFAYLDYQMEDYYEMRAELFTKAYNEGLTHPETIKIIDRHQDVVIKKVKEKQTRSRHVPEAIQRREKIVEISKLPSHELKSTKLFQEVSQLKQEMYEGLKKRAKK